MNCFSYALLIVIGLLSNFSAPQYAAAQSIVKEECFIVMTLEVDRTGPTPNFILSSYVGVHDLLQELVGQTGFDDKYKLEALDGGRRRIAEYGLPQNDYLIADGFDAGGSPIGEIVLQSQSTMDVVIPLSKAIRFIRIHSPGKSQMFGLNAASLTCNKTCLELNQIGTYKKDKCCLEYLPVDVGNFKFKCS